MKMKNHSVTAADPVDLDMHEEESALHVEAGAPLHLRGGGAGQALQVGPPPPGLLNILDFFGCC